MPVIHTPVFSARYSPLSPCTPSLVVNMCFVIFYILWYSVGDNVVFSDILYCVVFGMFVGLHVARCGSLFRGMLLRF